MTEYKIKEYYDVVIIGAGISGLTSAALLSKAGLSCCIIEMDKKVGGYLAGFDRKEFRFDSAIHWLNNCGEKGWVNKIFKIIGDDFPLAKEQKQIRRFVSNDINYLVTNQPEDLRRQWLVEFPADTKGINRFFNDAKKISKSFENYINLSRSMDTMNLKEKAFYGIKMLKFALPFIPHLKYTTDEGVEKGLNKYFKSEKLRRIFSSEPDILSCLIPISWAYSNNFQTPPAGGSQAFPEWLAHSSSQLGADIICGAKVTNIITENKTVKGVVINSSGNDTIIQSKYIVAASDAENLYEKLLAPNLVPEKKKQSLKNAKLYASAFTVSIAIDCNPNDLGLGEENIYFFDKEVSREELGKGDPEKSGIHILASSVRDHSLAPKGKGTITLFIPAWIENFNHWQCKINEEGNYVRTQEYRELKKKNAQILIERVEKALIPNFKKHILFFESATPITHLRYTGNKNGSMMGQKPGKENMNNKVASYSTPVKNLYQSGHWADLGGGIFIAMKSAVNTSLMILQKEKTETFNLLSRYIDGKVEIKELKSSKLFKMYHNNWKQILPLSHKE